MSERKIVGVAMLKNGLIYFRKAPARHANIFMDYGRTGLQAAEQGFLLDDGSFVNRVEALEIAKSNGQYRREELGNTTTFPHLFSEDLW